MVLVSYVHANKVLINPDLFDILVDEVSLFAVDGPPGMSIAELQSTALALEHCVLRG